MSTVRLRARSTTEIVDAAFMLYRQQPLLYILAAAVGNVPYLIGMLLLQAGTSAGSGATTLAGVLLTAASFVLYNLMGAVVMHIGSRAYLGETPDLAAALRAVVPRAGRLILASTMRGVLYTIGFFFLVFPALYVFARYFAIVPAIILEDASIAAAFRRSSVLSDGRKRHIINTLALVWIIFFIIVMGIGVLMALVSMSSTVLSTFFQTLITAVVYPIAALAEMVLYYDTRIRGEGFDLERMAADIGPRDAPAGAPRPI